MNDNKLKIELNSILSTGFARIKNLYSRKNVDAEINSEINKMSTRILKRIYEEKISVVSFIFSAPIASLKSFYSFLTSDLTGDYTDNKSFAKALLKSAVKILLSIFLIAMPFIFSLGSFSPFLSMFSLIMVIGFVTQNIRK